MRVEGEVGIRGWRGEEEVKIGGEGRGKREEQMLTGRLAE